MWGSFLAVHAARVRGASRDRVRRWPKVYGILARCGGAEMLLLPLLLLQVASPAAAASMSIQCLLLNES